MGEGWVTGSITAVEANAVHRIRSVSRRIPELRDDGLGIDKDRKHDVNQQR
jgi:CRP-like cAMP-binding protein